jgi:predicted cupin superfamily sugar epimerase
MKRIQQLQAQLQLQPHPEGGYFAETYRSTVEIDTPFGKRSSATAIYFLLTAGNFSAFHRIKSDEGWHHYEGDVVHIHVIHTNGVYECIKLGKNTTAGEVQQAMVPANAWFASECIGEHGYALVGCTVSPGFDFQDFELADRLALQELYPSHIAIIHRLTREV